MAESVQHARLPSQPDPTFPLAMAIKGTAGAVAGALRQEEARQASPATTFAGIKKASDGLAKKAQAAFSRSGPDTISSLRQHPPTPKVDGPKVEL